MYYDIYHHQIRYSSTVPNKIAQSLGVTKTQVIIDLILYLDFDFDRLSTSGKETYQTLLDELDLLQPDISREAWEAAK